MEKATKENEFSRIYFCILESLFLADESIREYSRKLMANKIVNHCALPKNLL